MIELDRAGFTLLPGAFDRAECDRIQADWDAACSSDGPGVLRNSAGVVYGARNLLELWPAAAQLMHQPMLMDALRLSLGESFGLVRALYFDKPPGDSWALPWHKDRAIAVRDNCRPTAEFRQPTMKYGVPHLEAPAWLLEQMLTARIHLDAVTPENGPLRVIPGSHRDGRTSTSTENEVQVLCERGDVLLIRPLVTHASSHAAEGTTNHRRILHLEFSPIRELPDELMWHEFFGPDSRSHVEPEF